MAGGPGARCAVGIDLGTTNCCLAWAPLDASEPPVPSVLPVPQFVAADQTAEHALLPSFLYLASEHERPAGRTAGCFARDRGAQVPDRLVQSAKSWLGAPGVDPRAPMLPWLAPAGVPKVSPVEASAAYLIHLKDAWEAYWRARGEELPLAAQDVAVTVPASFDALARQLTVEAAASAGLPGVALLEEPSAAFYAWLARHREDWQRILVGRRMVLVVDVGGGTTDFTLVAVRPGPGGPVPERVAVGDHLLAGGENMDQSLARLAEGRLGPPLDHARFTALAAECRRAKETLLSDDAPAQARVTVLGRGSSLVGGTLALDLGRDEVRNLLLDQFFPPCDWTAVPEPPARPGLLELGLPYARDPAVTQNLARFLGAHRDLPPVDAVLFNGGALRPRPIRERLLDALASWLPGGAPLDLTGDELDVAVAEGAATYMLARRGLGLRLGGGLRRSYYVGCAGADDAGRAVCVVPGGAEEGQTFDVEQPRFALLTGRPVRFSLYASSVRLKDAPGCLVPLGRDDLRPLPPLETSVGDAAAAKRAREAPVTLRARLTEVGTLELSCVELGGAVHDLTFHVRAAEAAPSEEQAGDPTLQAAQAHVAAVFARKPPTPLPKALHPRRLGLELEERLAQRREAWPTALCRALFAPLEAATPWRRRTPEAEESWLNLTGFCLRPGFGAPLDEWRLARVRPLLDERMQHPAVPGVRLAYWIFWRRVAAGLTTEDHERLYDLAVPHLLPGLAHLRRGPTPTAHEQTELWRLAASLEQVAPARKLPLARQLLEALAAGARGGFEWWALGRLLARAPLARAAHQVLPPADVAPWLERVLPLPWHERPGGASALVAAARATGQRSLDLPEDLRRRIHADLLARGVPPERARPVLEVVDRAREDSAELFGEALPLGLRLA